MASPIQVETLDRDRRGAERAADLERRIAVVERSGRSAAVHAERTTAMGATLLTTGYVAYLTAEFKARSQRARIAYYFVYSNDNSGAHRSITVRTCSDGVTVGQERTLDAALVSGALNRITASGEHILEGLTPGETYTITVEVLASAGAAVSIREAELTVTEP